MHNTPQANLEFKITSAETNLRYLLGDNPRNEPLIAETKKAISEFKSELETMKATSCKPSSAPRESSKTLDK